MRIPIKATAREPITQAGYISATSAIHAHAHLRSAAGPYIRVRNGSSRSTAAWRCGWHVVAPSRPCRVLSPLSRRPLPSRASVAVGIGLPGRLGGLRTFRGRGLALWLARVEPRSMPRCFLLAEPSSARFANTYYRSREKAASPAPSRRAFRLRPPGYGGQVGAHLRMSTRASSAGAQNLRRPPSPGLRPGRRATLSLKGRGSCAWRAV